MSARPAMALTALLAGVFGLGLACQPTPPVSAPAPVLPLLPPQATVRVEVLGAPPLVGDASGPVDLALVVDLTTSMSAPADLGIDWREAASRVAAEFLRALPADQPVEVTALGLVAPEVGSCAEATPLSGGESRAELIGRISRAGSALALAEGSLERAIDDARKRIEARRDARGVVGSPSRIAVLSDFGDSCGGNWCAAVQRAAAGGHNLELVSLAGPEGSPPDSCATGEAGVPLVASPGPRERLRFEVRRPAGAGGGERVLARSVAGAAGVPVAAGIAVVVVDLDPPEWIGPIELSPGTHTSVRILDFIEASPPWREVFVQPMKTEADPRLGQTLPDGTGPGDRH